MVMASIAMLVITRGYMVSMVYPFTSGCFSPKNPLKISTQIGQHFQGIDLVLLLEEGQGALISTANDAEPRSVHICTKLIGGYVVL